jgi:ATP-dependent Clp protease ATP-binding subunit ClpC
MVPTTLNLTSGLLVRRKSKVKRWRAEPGAPARPLGCFLLVGTDGDAATQIARLVAGSVFGDSDALLRLDLREYRERYRISALIGTPAGDRGLRAS